MSGLPDDDDAAARAAAGFDITFPDGRRGHVTGVLPGGESYRVNGHVVWTGKGRVVSGLPDDDVMRAGLEANKDAEGIRVAAERAFEDYLSFMKTTSRGEWVPFLSGFERAVLWERQRQGAELNADALVYVLIGYGRSSEGHREPGVIRAFRTAELARASLPHIAAWLELPSSLDNPSWEWGSDDDCWRIVECFIADRPDIRLVGED